MLDEKRKISDQEDGEFQFDLPGAKKKNGEAREAFSADQIQAYRKLINPQESPIRLALGLGIKFFEKRIETFKKQVISSELAKSLPNKKKQGIEQLMQRMTEKILEILDDSDEFNNNGDGGIIKTQTVEAIGKQITVMNHATDEFVEASLKGVFGENRRKRALVHRLQDSFSEDVISVVGKEFELTDKQLKKLRSRFKKIITDSKYVRRRLLSCVSDFVQEDHQPLTLSDILPFEDNFLEQKDSQSFYAQMKSATEEVLGEESDLEIERFWDTFAVDNENARVGSLTETVQETVDNPQSLDLVSEIVSLQNLMNQISEYYFHSQFHEAAEVWKKLAKAALGPDDSKNMRKIMEDGTVTRIVEVLSQVTPLFTSIHKQIEDYHLVLYPGSTLGRHSNLNDPYSNHIYYNVSTAFSTDPKAPQWRMPHFNVISDLFEQEEIREGAIEKHLLELQKLIYQALQYKKQFHTKEGESLFRVLHQDPTQENSLSVNEADLYRDLIQYRDTLGFAILGSKYYSLAEKMNGQLRRILTEEEAENILTSSNIEDDQFLAQIAADVSEMKPAEVEALLRKLVVNHPDIRHLLSTSTRPRDDMQIRTRRLSDQ